MTPTIGQTVLYQFTQEERERIGHFHLNGATELPALVTQAFPSAEERANLVVFFPDGSTSPFYSVPSAQGLNIQPGTGGVWKPAGSVADNVAVPIIPATYVDAAAPTGSYSGAGEIKVD